MKYCPSCAAEYRPGHDVCFDCQVELVDEPPELPSITEVRPTIQERIVVFRSGRRIEAEVVRSRLEADGLDARIWSSGLGPWMTVSALPEITGVPSDFNSHQVVVDANDVERALEVLGEVTPEPVDEDSTVDNNTSSTFLASLRKRWMLLAFAIFMLLLVIVAGPIGN